MHETPSLKSLAFKVLERLERNKALNKCETKGLLSVSRPIFDETNNRSLLSPLLLYPSSLVDDYEERVAIAEYEGHQNNTQAQRLAYLDAFMAVLATLPQEDPQLTYGENWLDDRIRAAKEWLLSQNFPQPK